MKPRITRTDKNNGFSCLTKSSETGSVFIMALCFLTIMAIISAAVLHSISARAPLRNQITGWHEAGLAAEAGVDIALAKLTQTCSGTAGWGEWVPSNDFPLAITGSYPNPPTGASYTGTSDVVYTRNALLSSTGTAAFVNISLQSFQRYKANGTPMPPWFKIRSMGTAPLSGPARPALEKWDSDLRRLSLAQVRDNLVAATGSNSSVYPDYWTPSNYTPSASRVIEVIAKPYAFNPFNFALYTQKGINLATSNNYGLDSYNSDTSLGGQYPGIATLSTTTEPDPDDPNYGNIAHWGANIGTNSTSDGAIDTNGTQVYGTGQTPQGAAGVNSAADIKLGVTTQQPIELPIKEVPEVSGWTTVATAVKANGGTLPANNGTEDHPTTYYADANPGGLIFTGTGYVTLVIPMDWNIGTGKTSNVVIPPSVYVTIYAGGDINFGNGEINVQPSSSGIPGHLLIYGTAPAGYGAKATDAKLGTSGGVKIAAAFYGPNYSVSISGGGGGAFYGSIVANSFSVSGGGAAAFHYDEALKDLTVSKVTKYQVSSYFEDSRL